MEPDPDYSAPFEREAGIMFTEDDLLWWRLKSTPQSPLDFSHADRIIAYAEANNQHVFAAHLAWDEGFGEGWTNDDLWGMSEQEARNTLFPTIQAMVGWRRTVPAGTAPRAGRCHSTLAYSRSPMTP